MAEPAFIPIYKRLTDFYKDRIVNQVYTPGSRIDSINKMMIRHDVSRETAKLVLRQLMDKGLIISKQGKGSYVVPQAQTKNVWGMVIPFYSSNMEQLINLLDFEAQRRGRELVYFLGYNIPEEEMRLVGKMILEGYEAVIVVPNYDESLTSDFYGRLIQGNTRVILADNTMSGSYFQYVVQSYDLGVKRAADYLSNQTDGNLLMVKNEAWKGRNLLHELMEQTFRSVVDDLHPEREVHVISQMRALSQQFFESRNISGVLCCADHDAIRVLGRLKRWGFQIPSQISLVSYGNTELTEYYEPGITVIDSKYDEMAKKTAMLIDEGNDAGPYQQHIIQPTLIVRGT